MKDFLFVFMEIYDTENFNQLCIITNIDKIELKFAKSKMET